MGTLLTPKTPTIQGVERFCQKVQNQTLSPDKPRNRAKARFLDSFWSSFFQKCTGKKAGRPQGGFCAAKVLTGLRGVGQSPMVLLLNSTFHGFLSLTSKMKPINPCARH